MKPKWQKFSLTVAGCALAAGALSILVWIAAIARAETILHAKDSQWSPDHRWVLSIKKGPLRIVKETWSSDRQTLESRIEYDYSDRLDYARMPTDNLYVMSEALWLEQGTIRSVRWTSNRKAVVVVSKDAVIHSEQAKDGNGWHRKREIDELLEIRRE